MKTALLFPGQGSQYVGMGRSLWEAFPKVRKLYQTAADLLGFDVERICFEGPKERLNTTLCTQPILFIVSVAVFRTFEQEAALPANFVPGHSLGEYAALVATGSLTFEDGLPPHTTPPHAGAFAGPVGRFDSSDAATGSRSVHRVGTPEGSEGALQEGRPRDPLRSGVDPRRIETAAVTRATAGRRKEEGWTAGTLP